MILSKQLYRSLRKSTTSTGELREAILVKPTMSEKKTVADANISGGTISPCLSLSAHALKSMKRTLEVSFASLKTHILVKSTVFWTYVQSNRFTIVNKPVRDK